MKCCLPNTCTIDNGLTILHLAFQQREPFRNFILNDKNEMSRTLLNIFDYMHNGDFVDAKLLWLEYTKCNLTNLFGDEFDFFMRHINCKCGSRNAIVNVTPNQVHSL